MNNNNKGVALVEMAIVLPLLIIIVFGIIEFGFIIYDKAMITNASREGARVGIIFRIDDSTGDPIYPTGSQVQAMIEQRIQSHLSTYLISLGSAQVRPSLANGGITIVSGAASGEELRVDVNYQYKFLVLNPGFLKSAPTINLSSTTIMRLE
jgi:Flp pilus assembly protein TadG